MPIYIKAFWWSEGFTKEDIKNGKEELIKAIREEIQPKDVMFKIEKDEKGNTIRIQAKLIVLNPEEIEDLQDEINNLSKTISRLKDKWITFGKQD